MNSKRFVITLISVSLTICLLLCGLVIFVDPMFHYHKPLSFLEYELNNERYQNNGILKHFDYDAIITGTSMCENFKVSQLNELFNVDAVSVCNSGGSYKEMSDQLKVAFDYNKDIKMVVWGLDYNRLMDDKDSNKEDLPIYMYDSSLLNDMNYLLNKEVIANAISTIKYTLDGNKTTSFDDYSNWQKDYICSKESLDNSYDRQEKRVLQLEKYTGNDRKKESDNLYQNIISLAQNHSDIQFYLFFTPYSIYYFDSLNQQGLLNKQLDAEKEAIKELLNISNIHLFSFFDNGNIICNLDNYRDTIHYGEWINSFILESMKNGNHKITKQNYQNYLESECDFLINYDFDALFN